MAAPMDTKQLLEATRCGFAEEGEWMRFLIDSYTGAGGFQGRVKQPPAGFWGSAAEAYSTFSSALRLADAEAYETNSYLDRFQREDIKKFQRRVNVAHYLNYVKPTTNTKVSYIVRKPHKRNNVPPKLADWIERTGYDKEFRRRAICAAVLGWFPMQVDMPTAPDGARTQAQAGQLDPYVVLNLPCHLRDYQLDEKGKFVWAKMAHCYEVKADWRSEAKQVTRYTIWTATEFEVYEVDGENIEPKGRGAHPFQQVPIIPWRADVSVEEHVKAESVNADIALEARRLFNLVSELDEHTRGQVFALLLLPGTPPQGKAAEIGVENGLQVDPESKHLPQYLAPPATVAETLEKRIEKTIIEIYRMALVEYEKASGANTSAQSREREFGKTNVSIASLAASLAAADRETLILVGRGLGIAEDLLQQIECSAHESYADESLTDELEQALQTVTLPDMGTTFRVEFLRRLAQKLLPGLGADTRKAIDSEIEEAVEQAEKERVAALETMQEDGSPPSGGGDGSEPDGDEEQAQAAE